MDRLREAKKRQDEEIARVQEFIDRFRYKATKAAQVQSRIKMLEKIERIEVPPERKRIHFQFPAAPKSGRMVFELKGAREGLRAEGRARSRGPAHRARRSHRARRPQRRRQVDADAAAVGRRGAGPRAAAREGHQVVMQYFAQDEATRLDPTLTVYETLSSGSPDAMIPAIRNILGGFLFSGDDVYKKVARAVGRRAHAPGGRADAAAAVEHAAARRADQSPRSRLEGSAARRAGRLRRHAHLRVARSLLRRAARHADRRGRRRQGDALSGHVQRISVVEGEAVRQVRRVRRGAAPGARTGAPAPQPAHRRTATAHLRTRRTRAPVAPAAPDVRAAEARSGRAAQARQGPSRPLPTRITELEARIAERERAIKELEARDGGAGVLRPAEQAKPAISTSIRH